MPAPAIPAVPTPRPRARSEAPFWNRMARRYAARPVADPAAYETKLAIMRDLLFEAPGAQVLEIGCGTGSTALALAPHAARVRAADVSEEMIAIARGKARAAGTANVRFEAAAFEDMDVAPESQDVVMAHSLLHLLRRRGRAIEAAWRWLRPGGAFVSSTVCMSEAAPWLRPVAPLLGAVGLFPPSLAFFTEAELVGSIEAHGFLVERRFRPGPKAAVFLVARKPG